MLPAGSSVSFPSTARRDESTSQRDEGSCEVPNFLINFLVKVVLTELLCNWEFGNADDMKCSEGKMLIKERQEESQR